MILSFTLIRASKYQQRLVRRVYNEPMLKFGCNWEFGRSSEKVDVILQKRVRGFHQVSKHKKHFILWFYSFQAFGNLLKPEARFLKLLFQQRKLV